MLGSESIPAFSLPTNEIHKYRTHYALGLKRLVSTVSSLRLARFPLSLIHI